MSTTITAMVHWDQKPVEPWVLHAANRAAADHCPDGAWIWQQAQVGLAQADLATLPEDKPGRPCHLGHCHIVASCRLDNRDVLRRSLPYGLLPPAPCDAEMILAAYLAWGPACVERLIGDFAFVIWDAAEERLFAARDLAGARSLYYYRDPNRLYLASELTQLLQEPSLPLVIDEDQVAEFLTPAYQWSTGWNLGMFKNFSAFPAGHLLLAQQGSWQLRPFWSWTTQTIARRPAPALLEEYQHLLAQAVTDRLRGNQPIALELSGGLDSTALVSIAANLPHGATQPLHTLSLLFAQVPATDEWVRIQALLDFLPEGRLTAHLLDASSTFAPVCLAADWQPASLVEPQQLQETIAHAVIATQASQAGCRVVITGEMGDAVNDGSPFLHYDLLRRGYWRESVRRLQIEWQRRRRRTLYNFLAHGLLPFLPWPLLRRYLHWSTGRQPPEELPAYFLPEYRRQLEERNRITVCQRATQWPIQSPTVRALLSDFFPTRPFLSAPKAAPVEYRHPYTDQRLLEFLLRLPPELKWEHEAANHFLAARHHHRRALQGRLPDAIRCGNRGVYFDAAIAHSMCPTQMINWLHQEPVIHLVERGYVDRQGFITSLTQGDDMSGYPKTLLCLEAWLRAVSGGGKMQQLLPARQSDALLV